MDFYGWSWKGIGLFLVLCLLLGNPVTATTYYVSPDGNDENPGSEASPWRTISYAASNSTSGDVILVNGGLYPNQSITVDKALTIVGYNGTGIVSANGTAISGNTTLVVSDNLTLSGLAFGNSYAGINLNNGLNYANLSDITILSQNNIGIFSLWSGHIQNIHIQNATVSSTNGPGFYSQAYTNLMNIDSLRSEYNQNGGLALENGRYVYVDDFSVISNNGTSIPGVRIKNISDSSFSNGEVAENTFGGMVVDGCSNLTLSNINIYDNTGGSSFNTTSSCTALYAQNLTFGGSGGISFSNLAGEWIVNQSTLPTFEGNNSTIPLSGNYYFNITNVSGSCSWFGINYTSADVPAGLSENTLNVLKSAGNSWVRVNATVNTTTRSVQMESSALSSADLIYGLFASYPQPAISQVTPGFGYAGRLLDLTINGSGFNQSAIDLNVTLTGPETSLSNITPCILSAESMHSSFLLGDDIASGTWNVSYTQDSLASNIFSGVTITQVPNISGIEPSTGINSETNLTITYNGTHFTTGAISNLTNGTYSIQNLTGAVVSANGTLLTARYNLSNLNGGSYQTYIINPDGGFNPELIPFTVTTPVPTTNPSLNSTVPTTGVNNATLFNLTCIGSNFVSGSRSNLTNGTFTLNNLTSTDVSPDGTVLTTQYNLTSLSGGSYNAYVINPDGGFSPENITFTVTTPVQRTNPSLNSTVPTTGVNNATLFNLTCIGSNFVSGSRSNLTNGTYSLNNLTSPDVSPDGTVLTTQYNLTSLSGGSYNAYVINPDGGFSPENITFTVTTPVPVPTITPTPTPAPDAPNITGIVPSSGYQNSTIPQVTISGSHFGYSNLVSFSSFNSSNFTASTVLSGNNLTINGLNLTGKDVGTYNVTVSNLVSGLSGDLISGFTINPSLVEPSPVIYSVSPGSAYVNSTVLQFNITGENLFDGDIVSLIKGQTRVNITGKGSDSGLIVTNVSLSGLSPGKYGLSVTNESTGLSGYLADALTITLSKPYNILTVPDQFSSISPYGTIEASAGSDARFEVSAKPGATISSVQLDGNDVALENGFLVIQNIDSDHVLTSTATLSSGTLVARFNASEREGSAPAVVSFTDESNGDPSQWYWSFGDGASSEEQNPVHVYENPGDYTVWLWVRGISGSGSTTEWNYLHIT